MNKDIVLFRFLFERANYNFNSSYDIMDSLFVGYRFLLLLLLLYTLFIRNLVLL